MATTLDDFQIDFKTILEASEDHVPARLGKFLAKFGFVVDLLYIWLSSDLLFGFKRSPPDRPKIDWNLPDHEPGPLAEGSQQQFGVSLNQMNMKRK